ncbi:MAG: ABC transporter permease, partial [Oscillospiraceae bacterium]|nr:ABC transporter permease [Oscillospiraceae bacterium]
AITSKMLDEEALAYLKAEPSVSDAMPILLQYTAATIRQESSSCLAWGVDGSAGRVLSLNVKHGRLLNRSDLSGFRNVCVVDESLAEKIYGRSNIVGKSVSMVIGSSYEDFEIVGVVETGGNILQSMMGEYVPTFLYMPYSTMQQLTGRTNLDQIAVKLKSDVDPDTAAKEITALLETKMKIPNGIHIENLNSHKDQLNNILNIITLILSVIGGISLVVAGLSIMTVMLVSVHERTREIGIKKSIGAGKKEILLEFLAESLFISLIGSLIGVSIGTAVIALGCLILGLEILLNLRLILFCIVFAITVGVLFGVYPAIKAAKMKPVDALRQM